MAYLTILLAAALALVTTFFALQNSTPVTVNMFFWTIESSLVVVIIGAATLGFATAILIGLFIAGFLKQIVPDDFIIKHLGSGNISSVIKATIFGIPLPVCSCSVIPLAQSLRKEGASKGAVQSFLISSPITGVDSILATYSFFGWFFTIYRVVSSMIIAILTGIIQNIFDKEEKKVEDEKTSSCSCHC